MRGRLPSPREERRRERDWRHGSPKRRAEPASQVPGDARKAVPAADQRGRSRSPAQLRRDRSPPRRSPRRSFERSSADQDRGRVQRSGAGARRGPSPQAPRRRSRERASPERKVERRRPSPDFRNGGARGKSNPSDERRRDRSISSQTGRQSFREGGARERETRRRRDSPIRRYERQRSDGPVDRWAESRATERRQVRRPEDPWGGVANPYLESNTSARRPAWQYGQVEGAAEADEAHSSDGEKDSEPDEELTEEQLMEKLIGTASFKSTKNECHAATDVSAVAKRSKRRYRQYMNRRGGFNRPLSPVQ